MNRGRMKLMSDKSTVSNDSWDRRAFLKRVALGCAGVGGIAAAAGLLADPGRDAPLVTACARVSRARDFSAGLDLSDIRRTVASASGDAVAAVRGALAALGGIGRFVRRGDTVVVKPNVGWDRTPLQAANTNPLVVSALVALCREAGAAKVIVTDNPCNEARRCFTRSGIWKAAEEAGAEVVIPEAYRFREYELGGAVLRRMPVLADAVEADRVINVPIAKHHGLSGFTGAMKNLYGVLGGRRDRLHQRIDESIADLTEFVRPTLTVMDATRVLVRNGPQGGDLGDTKDVGRVVASVDPVAVDALACGFIGVLPTALPYLGIAAARGLGASDLSRVTIKEVS
jgi:uncharacterized protein (DUF362 family)